MIIGYLLAAIVIIYLIIASITDIKTREVPDWLSYSLIAIGLGLRAIQSIYSWDIHYFLWGFLGFLVLFIIGCAMYYTKQWGGGDAKLLMGVGSIFGSNPFNFELDTQFLPSFLIYVLVIGGIYSLIASLFLIVKNYKKFFKQFKGGDVLISELMLVLALVIFVLSFIFVDYFALGLILALALVTPIILISVKIIEKIAMVKLVNPHKLTEGDWVIKDVIYKGKVILSSKKASIDKKDIQKLIKCKIQKVLLKIGLPFVPVFLIAALLTLLFGYFFFSFF